MKKETKQTGDLDDKRYSNDSLLQIMVMTFILLIVTFLFLKIVFF